MLLFQNIILRHPSASSPDDPTPSFVLTRTFFISSLSMSSYTIGCIFCIGPCVNTCWEDVLTLKTEVFFFLLGFSFTDIGNSQDSRGREGTIFYSTLPLPPTHEHWDIYLQLCMWDDYHVFLIATLVFTRLLLDEIYHLIELLFDWLMM